MIVEGRVIGLQVSPNDSEAMVVTIAPTGSPDVVRWLSILLAKSVASGFLPGQLVQVTLEAR